MLISFVLPFYGPVSLLRRCLESLAAQTDGDFEAIVVDDASPEDGEALTRSFGERFRYVRQPANLSCYQARKRGIIEAKGDYVVPVDPDDYVLPDLVAELRRNLNLSPQPPPDIVIYNVEQDTAGVVTPHWCRYAPGCFTPEQVLDKMVRKELQWNVWSKVIRRSVWMDVLARSAGLSSIQINPSEDFCIVVPLVLASRDVKVVPYVGYRYCQNSESICKSLSLSKVWAAIRDTLKARKLVLDFAHATGQSIGVMTQIRSIARMIVRWWTHELVVSVRPVLKVLSFMALANISLFAAFWLATDRLPCKLEGWAETDGPVTVSTSYGRSLGFFGQGWQAAEAVVPVGLDSDIRVQLEPVGRGCIRQLTLRSRKILCKIWEGAALESLNRGSVLDFSVTPCRYRLTRPALLGVVGLQVLLLAFALFLFRRVDVSCRMDTTRASLCDAAVVACPLALLIAVVVPLRVYLGNGETFDLPIADLSLDMAVLFAKIWLVSFVSVCGFSRLGLRWVTVLPVALAAAVYLESGPLSADLPVLNGEISRFCDMRRGYVDASIVLTLIFVIIAGYWGCCRYLSAGRLYVLVFSSLLVVMPAASLIDAYKPVAPRQFTLEKSGVAQGSQADVLKSLIHSPKRNVALYILDSISTPHAVDVLSQAEDIRSALDGFVCYTNHVGMYYGTIQSVAGIMTGKYYTDPSRIREYCRLSSGEKTFVRNYLSAGADIFCCPGGMGYGLSTRIDASLFAQRKPHGGLYCRPGEALQWNLYEIARLQIAPFLLKLRTYFDTTTGWDTRSTLALEKNCYAHVAAAPTDADCPLTLQFWHTDGSHAPLDVNRQGVAWGVIRTDYQAKVEKTWYALSELAKHLRTLRERGLYDSTLIVVMADHGTYPEKDGLESDDLYAVDDFKRQDRVSVRALPFLLVKPERSVGPLAFSALSVGQSKIYDLMVAAATNCVSRSDVERILACSKRLFRQDDGANLLDCLVDENLHPTFVVQEGGKALDLEPLRIGRTYPFGGLNEAVLRNARIDANNVVWQAFPGFGMTVRAPARCHRYLLRLRIKMYSPRLGNQANGWGVVFSNPRTGMQSGLAADKPALPYDVLLEVESDENGLVDVMAENMKLALHEFELLEPVRE